MTIPGTVRRLVISPLEFTALRIHAEKPDSPVPTYLGLEVQRNGWVPEGIAAGFDANGQLVGVYDLRGDHHVDHTRP